MKARIGDRSRVPPSGGMMPLKRLRYGSHRVLHGTKTGSLASPYTQQGIRKRGSVNFLPRTTISGASFVSFLLHWCLAKAILQAKGDKNAHSWWHSSNPGYAKKLR
jgi:hypothetical protein